MTPPSHTLPRLFFAGSFVCLLVATVVFFLWCPWFGVWNVPFVGFLTPLISNVLSSAFLFWQGVQAARKVSRRVAHVKALEKQQFEEDLERTRPVRV